ncbi:MAG: protein kinase domain-containing protein [Calditrichia bacterium]
MHLPFSTIGDVQLTNIIYVGPYNLVAIGEQSNLQRRVLVKLLRPGIEGEEDRVKRFQKEARACARLKHPHIVDVHKLGEEQGYHYIILEYVDGLNLEELLEKNGQLEAEVVFQMADEILQALNYAHAAGVTHRDIKPANVLLAMNGKLKVTDFGLARVEGDSTVTHQDAMVGSPAYMSPEQITGDDPDGRADLFSLGCVLYELLTGKQAFEGESFTACLHKILNEDPQPLAQLRKDLTDTEIAFITKLLAKRADERWSSASEARNALQGLRRGDFGAISELLSKFAEQHQRVLKPSGEIAAVVARRKRWPLVAGGVALLTLLAFVAVLMQQSIAAKISVDEDPGQSFVDSSFIQSDSLIADISRVVRGVEEQAGLGEIVPEQQSDLSSGLSRKDFSEEESERGEVQTNDSLMEDVLAVAPGKLILNVDPWASVFVDEKKVEARASNLELSLPAGQHSIRLTHPNFPPSVNLVTIEAGSSRELSWSFYNNMGYLELSVRPWADVYIDNKLYGTTPLKKPLMLAPGSYLLELRHPQQNRKDRITIVKGDTLTRRVTLNLR